ncbi:hypothetical protein J8273_0530 [Carpediemonas membranifera]|uniref:Uncharacterized protein n=1 Tax=Carpediemonas membranifera TaxID=201153 RepID=A0A8J6AY40_9EUKA|nr:hypothetical protein J8273_0530 [Carpediemonas membranifera]|eukprot:KAG9395300.1 hypothetical protein J8273_0530 [Carpediemonas membranifera]
MKAWTSTISHMMRQKTSKSHHPTHHLAKWTTSSPRTILTAISAASRNLQLCTTLSTD